jgi:hypothetical protein
MALHRWRCIDLLNAPVSWVLDADIRDFFAFATISHEWMVKFLKTRLIGFGRFAAASRKKRGAGKPETFQFSGVYTHLRTVQEVRQIPCSTQDRSEALPRKASRAEGGTSTRLARASGRTRPVLEKCGARLLQLPRRAQVSRQSQPFSAGSVGSVPFGVGVRNTR